MKGGSGCKEASTSWFLPSPGSQTSPPSRFKQHCLVWEPGSEAVPSAGVNAERRLSSPVSGRGEPMKRRPEAGEGDTPGSDFLAGVSSFADEFRQRRRAGEGLFTQHVLAPASPSAFSLPRPSFFSSVVRKFRDSSGRRADSAVPECVRGLWLRPSSRLPGRTRRAALSS